MTRQQWWSLGEAENGGIKRPFTRLANASNLGPTGARLWATYLANVPGMQGSFEFIHKVNVPRLFAVHVELGGKGLPLEYVRHRWYPAYLEVVFEGPGLQLVERKFVTWDDCAVDVITLHASSGEGKPNLRVEWGSRPGSGPVGSDWSFSMHGHTVYVSGESMHHAPETWKVVSAMGLAPDEAAGTASRWARMTHTLDTHLAEYASWFDDIPQFECSEPAYERMWDYRWYLLRRNLAHPRLGKLPFPSYYEGRSAKMTMDPWQPRGWEFSRIIPFSTAFHLLEGRWKRDASACQGEILNLVRSQGEDGLFRVVSVDKLGADYTDLVPWGAWQLYLVRRDREWLGRVGQAMARQVRGTAAAYDENGWSLPIVRNHNRTGKEYQPSFFYGAGYPKRPTNSECAPLARVDAACYFHLNALAAMRIMSEIGDVECASEMQLSAERTRAGILSRMWDGERGFFYDIGAQTGERVLVENVVGLDPFLAEVAGDAHLAAFRLLSDPRYFAVRSPVPSTSLSSPAYAPDASWMGDHLKGEHGAMWNGPAWPYANSTVLMAIANATRANGHTLDVLFADLFRRYTLMCFRREDIADPIVYEHYNPETGEPISQEEDYFHSTWIDLVIRCIAGIEPGPQGVTFDPIDCGIERFSLCHVCVGEDMIDVEYERRSGYSFRINGKPIERSIT